MIIEIARLQDHNLSIRDYPYTRKQIKAEHPNTSLKRDMTPEEMLEFRLARVVTQDPPQNVPRRRVAELGPPVRQGKQFVRTWTVRNKTQAELDAEEAEEENTVQDDLNSRLGQAIRFLWQDMEKAKGNANPTLQQFKHWYKINASS